MDKKIAVITGANSGIGFVTAAKLADMGIHVVMACRDQKRGQAALDALLQTPGRSIELMLCDLADLASIRAFAEAFLEKYDALDILVNNAGVLLVRRAETKDGFEEHLGVNCLGHFALTMQLLPAITAAKGRIVSVSSCAHTWCDVSFDDINLTHGYNVMRGYGQSKLCILLVARELDRRLKAQSIPVTVNAVHPGLVATQIVVKRPDMKHLALAKLSRLVLISPDKGAMTSVYLATSPEVKNISGEYFCRCRVHRSSKNSHDADKARRLFELCEKMTGVKCVV